MLFYAITLILSLVLALYGVPLAQRAALRFNIVDRPDGRLKHQQEPVPYLGGLAIYLAFLTSLAFTFEFRQDVLGIILSGTIIVMLGLIDDFGVLAPMTKLIGQLLVVFILIKSGIRIQISMLPEWADLALTVLWMIGLINAFNLLDIMDGLAAGVGVICAGFLFVVAVLSGDQGIAFMLTALIGSLLGFLRYNWQPAKIYMGDAGAMFIGLMLGALSMIGKYPSDHPLSLLAPVFILGVPIFDTLFVMYIRSLRGLPVFLGSPDHFAIRLRHWGLPVSQVVLISYGSAIVVGTVGLSMMVASQETAMILCGLTAFLFGVAAVLLTKVDVSKPEQSSLAPSAAARPGGRSSIS